MISDLCRKIRQKAIDDGALCENCPANWNGYVASEIHDSDIAIIGESPVMATQGKNKTPFSGWIRQEIDEAIAKSGHTRKDASYLDACCCEHYTGRGAGFPSAREIECCKARLRVEVNRLKPKAIVTCGRTPLRSLGIKASFGKKTSWNGIPVFPIPHPAMIRAGKTATQRHNVRKTLERAIEEAFKC